jgi:hypothetical protein
MLIADLLPTALAAWRRRRPTQATDVQFSRPIAPAARPVMRSAVASPCGATCVDLETHTALTALNGYARSRFVELQVAVEPGLVVQADPADYRACLRNLLLAAIGRASSGVLVTAMRQAEGIEIAVLDDGTVPAGVRSYGSTLGADGSFVSVGGTARTDYHPQRGTTVRLRLPRSAGVTVASDADAHGGLPVYATY